MNKLQIKILRVRLGLTQEAMAKKLGVSPVTVSRWETGDFIPSRMGLEKIMKLKKGALDESI